MVNRKINDFSILNLYPTTLLKLVSGTSFFVVVVKIWIFHVDYVICKQRHFISSVCILFMSICCLAVLARTSCTMLNRSGESNDLWLVPDIGGKSFLFLTIKCDISYRIFVDFPLWSRESSPLFLDYSEFLSWMGIWFSQMLFSIDMII